MWVYGSGFPKSRNIGKDMDKTAGAQREVIGTLKAPGMAKLNVEQGAQGRSTYEFPQYSAEPITDAAKQWQGWGTALKPAHEPICVARKPLIGTVAENVLAHGTGAINVDGCRVDGGARPLRIPGQVGGFADVGVSAGSKAAGDTTQGRWPANFIHDGSDEVVAGFPALNDSSAARFFYCAKASKSDRGDGNIHPTVKPTDLMRYLCRLVTPPGGVVLDPFMGSGSTGKAATLEGFEFIGIDMTPEYVEIARARIEHAAAANDNQAPQPDLFGAA
jgi:site-specific DNA-methyltransferase (adenine-specific)